MFKVNDYVMYATTGVCRIVEIRQEKLMGNEEEEYYILRPVYQNNATTIRIPVKNQTIMMRHLTDREEIDALIDAIPSVNIFWIDNDRQRNEKCREALHSGRCEEWIKMLCNLRSRKEFRTAQGKKFAQADDNFMKLAEKLLYEEFSVSLHIPLEKVGPYILGKLH